MSDTPQKRAYAVASWLRQRADQHNIAGLAINAAGPMYRPERAEELFLQAAKCFRAAHTIENYGGNDDDGI